MSATKGTRPQLFVFEVERGGVTSWEVFEEVTGRDDLQAMKSCPHLADAVMMARRRGRELVLVTAEAAYLQEAYENHEGIMTPSGGGWVSVTHGEQSCADCGASL